MIKTKIYSLREIGERIGNEDFPFSGETELGSAYFNFLRPAACAGLAIHAGSRIREDLRGAFALSKAERRYEEDPATDRFLEGFPLQIIGRDSRYEYDINRERSRAIYRTPEDAWGSKVWERPLTPEERERSLAKYDEFHRLLDLTAGYLTGRNRTGIIFDLHSYNYQREESLPWYLDKKPAVNLGTKPVNRALFGGLIDGFLDRLREIEIGGRPLPTAENDVFQGGWVSKRLSAEHYDRLLVLTVEFKKIFMDEKTGVIDEDVLEELIDKFSRAVKETIIPNYSCNS